MAGKRHVIKAGHYIVWENKSKCVLLLDKRGNVHRIWGIPRGSDNKFRATFIRSQNDFLDFSYVLAHISNLDLENVKVPAHLGYGCILKFTRAK